jgi:hypothetical protein
MWRGVLSQVAFRLLILQCYIDPSMRRKVLLIGPQYLPPEDGLSRSIGRERAKTLALARAEKYCPCLGQGPFFPDTRFSIAVAAIDVNHTLINHAHCRVIPVRFAAVKAWGSNAICVGEKRLSKILCNGAQAFPSYCPSL